MDGLTKLHTLLNKKGVKHTTYLTAEAYIKCIDVGNYYVYRSGKDTEKVIAVFRCTRTKTLSPEELMEMLAND